MTACVKNHSKRVALAISASLVGALSLGAAAPAVAFAANDGIQALAADWSTGAKVTEAEDGKGAAYTGDLSKPVSFDLGSGKYLVPTQVTNQNGDETDVTNKPLAYKAVKDSTDTVAPFDGLKASFNYTYMKDDGTYAPIVKGDALTADHFEAYLAGKLYTCAATDASQNNGAVSPVAGTYNVTVGGKVSRSFSLVGEDSYAGSFAFVSTDGTGDFDAAAGDSKDIVFDNNTTYNDIVTSRSHVRFAKADGTVIAPTSIQLFTADGTNVSSDVYAVAAGDYTAVLYDASGETTRVNFTVEKFDISKYGKAFDDVFGSFGPVSSAYNFVENVTSGRLASGYDAIVTNPNGGHTLDSSIYGEYTVKITANGDIEGCVGEKTYTFSNLNTDIFSTLSPLSLYYGAEDVLASSYAGVSINLTEGESFDASKIKVRSKDGATVYSGDQLEVTYKQGSTAVDASALTKAGTYTVTVRVKPFQDADGDWVGGTRGFTVTVNGNKAYGDNVSFYVDGEVADATEQLEYDGSDLLQRVSARVSNPEGGQFEYGTDFELEAEDESGKVVDQVVDAGKYTISIKPLTFTVDEGEDIDFTLEVTPLSLSGLKDFGYAQGYKPWLSDDYMGHSDEAVAWTGGAVEVPGVQYEDAKGNWVALDPSLYNVVSIKDESGKVVKEAVDEGTYTVKIALSDAAKSNYSLQDREFTFEVRKYSPFDDVKSPAWYAQVVNTAKYTNIVNGISGTNMFAPESQISRKDAVCIIFNMAGGDSWDGENDFTYSQDGGWYTGFGDCDGNAYYAKALAWAHNLGIANGFEGSFRPDDRITREELASMLANYAKVTGDYVVSDGSALAGLSDGADVSGFARDNVAWAVENGIMGNGGYVAAHADITRAEVAAMAVNYSQKF